MVKFEDLTLERKFRPWDDDTSQPMRCLIPAVRLSNEGNGVGTAQRGTLEMFGEDKVAQFIPDAAAAMIHRNRRMMSRVGTVARIVALGAVLSLGWQYTICHNHIAEVCEKGMLLFPPFLFFAGILLLVVIVRTILAHFQTQSASKIEVSEVTLSGPAQTLLDDTIGKIKTILDAQNQRALKDKVSRAGAKEFGAEVGKHLLHLGPVFGPAFGGVVANFLTGDDTVLWALMDARRDFVIKLYGVHQEMTKRKPLDERRG